MDFGTPKDPLGVEPDWRDVIDLLEKKRYGKIAAILFVMRTNRTIDSPPGSILSHWVNDQVTEYSIKKPRPVLAQIRKKYNAKVEEAIEQRLGIKDYSARECSINLEAATELLYGRVKGISGRWRKKARGGTWAIYTSSDSSKVLKVPHDCDRFEAAELVLAHEKVAETMEEICIEKNYIVRPVQNHSVAKVSVNGEKMLVAVMDYEKDYVSPGSADVEKARAELKKLYETGVLPTITFDYDEKGLERKNLARRDDLARRDKIFIALDLCDRSVLENKEFLQEHSIPEKAEELGFSRNPDSLLSSILNIIKRLL